MNILLLNTNPVVSRLIHLCIREEDLILEEVADVSDVQRDSYDLVCIDDSSYVREAETFLQTLMFRKKVLLASKKTETEILDAFEEVIQKPFLPSQITTLIKSLYAVATKVEESSEEYTIFPLKSEEEEDETTLKTLPEEELLAMPEDPKILNSLEVEKIKALLEDTESEEDYEARKVKVIKEHLEDEGIEIVEEDQIADLFNKEIELDNTPSAKKVREKKKKSSKKKQKKEKDNTFEELLLIAIKEMKPKKIKKLLKGAEVTIKINFKDEN